MNITVEELKKRGYVPLADLVYGKVVHAYQSPDRRIILYWLEDHVCWYLQTFFDFPSIYPTPFTTFEQLDAQLRSWGH